MNTNLLLETADYIEKHPDEFRMDTWFCGTAACIAGTAVWLAGWDLCSETYKGRYIMRYYACKGEDVEEIPLLARKLLDIKNASLFNLFSWPLIWSQKYNWALTKRERAHIAAQYIRAYAKNGTAKKKVKV